MLSEIISINCAFKKKETRQTCFMKELSISSLNRIANQYETTFNFLKEASEEQIQRKPAPGKWSVHENLAHLGRYQEVFSDRLKAILIGNNPTFDRYLAENDPEFNRWKSYSHEELLVNFKATRRKLFNLLIELKPDQVERKGCHPRFGEMNVAWWTEFFLLHEAHHLFTIYALLCESMVSSEQVKY